MSRLEPQRNCIFMISASVYVSALEKYFDNNVVYTTVFLLYSYIRCKKFLCSLVEIQYRSRIHEHTISLRFLSIILRVSDLRFGIQCSLKTLSKNICWGVGNPRVERWLWIARRKTLKTFVPITSKNSASAEHSVHFGVRARTYCTRV